MRLVRLIMVDSQEKMLNRLTRLTVIMAVLVFFFLSGCAAVGPKTIARDRFDYATAVADSWKRVMLLNIVKLRYGDTPVFLEVVSIINQYSLEGQLSAGASFSSGLLKDTARVDAGGKYTDRPTITYSPLTGPKLTRSLLKPIPPTALLSLIQAGWPMEFLFLVCVRAINGIHNQSAARLIIREEHPDWDRLLAAFTRIQQSGGLGMRIERKDGKESSVMFFPQKLDEAIAQEFVAVTELLGLNPEAREFNLAYGSIPEGDREIAILTRSMIEITAELAARVEVPAKDVAENRASPGLYDKVDPTGDVRGKVRIQSSTEEPDDAFITIKYRDHWFYIDDRDFLSKRMFSFLMFLFTLAETGGGENAPVITIPAG